MEPFKDQSAEQKLDETHRLGRLRRGVRFEPRHPRRLSARPRGGEGSRPREGRRRTRAELVPGRQDVAQTELVRRLQQHRAVPHRAQLHGPF